MSQNKPKIYWHPNSAPCRGTWLAVQNMGIDVDWHLLKLAEKEQYSPEFLKINPMHCVPTLDDNGYVIWESRAISTYLANEKTSATSLYPSAPKKRGLIDARLYFDATFLHMRLRAITRPILYDGETTISEAKIEGVREAYGYLEEFLSQNYFVAGDSLTLADCHVLACVAVSKMLGIGFDKHPKIAKWYEKCRDVVKGFNEHEEFVQKYVELIKSKLK